MWPEQWPTTLLSQVRQRLAGLGLLPELEEALVRLAEQDAARLEQGALWGWLIPALVAVLDGPQELVQPFAAAWSILFAATGHLDAIQDGDPLTPVLQEAPDRAVQINLLLAYSVLANALLDELSPRVLVPHRVDALRRMWSDLLLWAASGQHRDLLAAQVPVLDDVLASYEQLARAKTGAVFALAFGGVGVLLSDDPQLHDALLLCGVLFGLLVQYFDDLGDAEQQPEHPLTLPAALRRHLLALNPLAAVQPDGFCTFVWQGYRSEVQRILAPLTPALQAGIMQLFERTFAAPGRTPS